MLASYHSLKINTCVWESLWLNHQIVCQLLGPVACVAGLGSCSLFLCHCFAEVPPLCESMWDGVTPAIPIWEEAVAGSSLPASLDSSSCFYGMKGNGVIPVWRAQDKAIEVHGHHSSKRLRNSSLFSNHLRNSRTALLASERQHGHSWSWAHSRFLQHWHKEMHCDIQW